MPLRSAGRGFDEEWPTVNTARENGNGGADYSCKSSYDAPTRSTRTGSHSQHNAEMHINPSDCVVTSPSYGPDDFSFIVNSTGGASSGVSVISDANEMSTEDFDDNVIIEDDSSYHHNKRGRRLPILTAFLHQHRKCVAATGILFVLLLGISLGTDLSRNKNNKNGGASYGLGQAQSQWGLVPTSPRYLPLREALVELHGGDRTPFISVDSLHHQALIFLADEDPRQLSPDDPTLAQRFALAMLFYSTFGMSWKSKRKWMTGENECNWEGVFCGRDEQHVDTLILRDNGLKGEIIDLSLLHELQQLDLSDNIGLKDTWLPETLGLMRNLRALHLNGCGLVGTIPESFWTPHLEIIDLGGNLINGNLSPTIKEAVSLQKLLLERNLITGSIPAVIGQLPLLNEIYLGNNKFLGEVPNLSKLNMLREISLHSNKLIGSLPELPKDQLRSIDVSNNTLVGVLGTKVQGLPQLMELKLSNNFFSDDLNELDMSRSLKLEVLALNDNRFRGTFPEWIAPLIELRELKLYGNAGLVGDIPDTVCDLVNIVQSLDVLSIDCNKIQCTCCTQCCDSLGVCMQEKPEDDAM